MDLLVEEDSGADDELEDVFQGLHCLQQLLRQLLSIVHIVLKDFGELPEDTQTHRHRRLSQSASHVFG